jgi:SSS family solute:Na+ symporter
MIDQIIVGLYLIITLAVGLYVGRNTKTIEDFAIGPRNFSNIALIATIFASVVDAGMTTGLASSTYRIGPIFLLSFLGIILSNINVSLFIAPKMKPFLGLLSSGDIFEKLYGKRAKTLMGCSTIIESTLTAAIQILAITHISQYFFNVQPIVASIVVTMIIVIYSFRGGIRSITATDVFQFGIMVIAIPIMCGLALSKIGGFYELAKMLEHHKLYFPGQDSGNHFEYVAVFISFSLPCLYPLCIQRMLMAKSTKQISSTFLINGLLSLPFYLTVGIIGFVAYIAIPGTDPNMVFPALINHVLPIGVKGLVLAGLIAVFMSTVDSILNIGSIAIIHDVLGSLVKGGLDPQKELKLMKGASLMVVLSAVAICHLFRSVTDIVFFLMVIGNSIFFPGFFWGIMGFKPSKNGFWLGIAIGALTVLICTIGLGFFPLYTMLIAISLNSSVILIDSYLEKPLQSLPFSHFMPSDKKYVIKNMRQNASLNDLIKNQDYCTIFLVCAIAISLSPFFFSSIHGLASFDATILIISIITAITSFAMLFRELWWSRVGKLFPIVWMLILTTALPFQSSYLLFKSDFSLVWLADCLIIMPLMFLLITRNAVMLSFGLGFIAALILSYLSNSSLTPNIAIDFGYLALVAHFLVLVICLALFRKHDYEAFVLNSSTLAHEVSRSFLAFENAACYLNKYLPEMVSNYQYSNRQRISQKALDELLALPSQLENAAKRSRYIVEKLSFFSIASRSHFEVFDIAICINSSISDPSIKNALLGKLAVINSNPLTISGDINQITQVLINLLENALHATFNKPKSIIQIIVDKNVVIIRDTGDGILKADLPNIFDDRFSTKSSKGQGLAFCKSVMKNHGGTINCSSIHGEFTEFRLHFPTINHG